MNNHLWMSVEVYISMKRTPWIVSHLIKRSPLSLNTRKYQVASKLEHPYSNIHCWLSQQPMILTPENTHQQSQLQYSRKGSMKSTAGRYLRQICTSSINAIDHSVRRSIQTSHPHPTLSRASWTMSSSLLIFSSDNNAMISRYNTFYMNYPPGLKSFSLKCVVADLKVCILSAQTVEKFPVIYTSEYKKQGSSFPHYPDNFKRKKVSNCFKLGPFQAFHGWNGQITSLLASSTTNDLSSWKYTSTITNSINLRRIYETHIGKTLKTNSRNLNHCNQSFYKKSNTIFPSTSYFIYSLVNHVLITTNF